MYPWVGGKYIDIRRRAWVQVGGGDISPSSDSIFSAQMDWFLLMCDSDA